MKIKKTSTPKTATQPLTPAQQQVNKFFAKTEKISLLSLLTILGTAIGLVVGGLTFLTYQSNKEEHLDIDAARGMMTLSPSAKHKQAFRDHYVTQMKLNEDSQITFTNQQGQQGTSQYSFFNGDYDYFHDYQVKTKFLPTLVRIDKQELSILKQETFGTKKPNIYDNSNTRLDLKKFHKKFLKCTSKNNLKNLFNDYPLTKITNLTAEEIANFQNVAITDIPPTLLKIRNEEDISDNQDKQLAQQLKDNLILCSPGNNLMRYELDFFIIEKIKGTIILNLCSLNETQKYITKYINDVQELIKLNLPKLNLLNQIKEKRQKDRAFHFNYMFPKLFSLQNKQTTELKEFKKIPEIKELFDSFNATIQEQSFGLKIIINIQPNNPEIVQMMDKKISEEIIKQEQLYPQLATQITNIQQDEIYDDNELDVLKYLKIFQTIVHHNKQDGNTKVIFTDEENNKLQRFFLSDFFSYRIGIFFVSKPEKRQYMNKIKIDKSFKIQKNFNDYVPQPYVNYLLTLEQMMSKTKKIQTRNFFDLMNHMIFYNQQHKENFSFVFQKNKIIDLENIYSYVIKSNVACTAQEDNLSFVFYKKTLCETLKAWQEKIEQKDSPYKVNQPTKEYLTQVLKVLTEKPKKDSDQAEKQRKQNQFIDAKVIHLNFMFAKNKQQIEKLTIQAIN